MTKENAFIVAVLVSLYTFLVFSGSQVAAAQVSPLSPLVELIPAELGDEVIYFPAVFRYVGTDTIYTESTVDCGNDPTRGPLYRYLSSSTITIFNPVAEMSASGCACGLLDARARGAALGVIVAMMFKVVGSVFSIIGSFVGTAIGLLGQIITIATAQASELNVSCTTDMELFCFGVAAVVALDQIGGNVIYLITQLLVAIASIYLIFWIISQVREIMQPGDGGE